MAMLFRRFAVAIGLLVAALASQLPEFTQQYRQRLGGAIDELNAQIAQFDSEAGNQSLSREQGIARLESNGDALARQRGEAMAGAVGRKDRLERQRVALATAGPLAQYAVLAEDLDTGLARQAAGDFQPAIPASPGGFVAAGIGFVTGWLLAHLAALPLRRRRAALPATR